LTEHVFDHSSPEDCEDKALAFLRELWEEVETEEIWQVEKVETQVKCYSYGKTVNYH
jgi:hypothetical protein